MVSRQWKRKVLTPVVEAAISVENSTLGRVQNVEQGDAESDFGDNLWRRALEISLVSKKESIRKRIRI